MPRRSGRTDSVGGPSKDPSTERNLLFWGRDNHRSHAVMERLGLRRDESLDFTSHDHGFGSWHGLVWVATRPDPT